MRPLGAIIIALAASLPAVARAHAILVDSQPEIDATVPASPLDLTLRFNSRIDQARSRLTLTAPDGGKSTPAIATDSADDKLRAQLPALPPGHYSLRWQVLAVDGHITRGDVPFTVAP